MSVIVELVIWGMLQEPIKTLLHCVWLPWLFDSFNLKQSPVHLLLLPFVLLNFEESELTVKCPTFWMDLIVPLRLDPG